MQDEQGKYAVEASVRKRQCANISDTEMYPLVAILLSCVLDVGHRQIDAVNALNIGTFRKSEC